MSIENKFFLLDSPDDVDIAIRDDDSLGVVGEVIKIIELLDLVRFVL